MATTDIAIIGTGPYGLSLSAHLNARGISHRIFGKPMESWAAHMPKNMKLKSEGFASNLSAPASDSTIKAWSARNARPYADRWMPISLDQFLDYAKAFRARFAPGIEETMVTSLEQVTEGFVLTLDNGEKVAAKNVVMAIGITHFAYTPELFSQLPQDRVSHSFDHRDVARFRNKDVAVIGAGSSAINLAQLLQEQGANPRIVARSRELCFNDAPDPARDTLLFRLQNPPSTIGRGWKSYFCAEAPLLFYRLPRHLKDRAIASHMHPAAGWYMREEVEGRIATSLGRNLLGAELKKDRVALRLANTVGGEEVLTFDHVVAATGYRVDLARVPFLSPSLRADIALAPGGSPFVSDSFQTSVEGLYTIGFTAMEMFGPLLRFMVGAEFAAPRLASHLEQKLESAAVQRAA